MSYTFSRRDFMKYTVLAAAAVAVSGSLTGCSNNPNQPYSEKPEGTLSFGGSGSFWGIGSSDKQTLSHAVFNGDLNKTGVFECDFEHSPVVDSFFAGKYYYKISVDYNNGKTVSYGAGSTGVVVDSVCDGPMDANKTYKNHVKFTGIDYTNAKKISIYYYPKTTALGNTSDSYGDVHAGWNITSIIMPKSV